jgi:hypothetical protein
MDLKRIVTEFWTLKGQPPDNLESRTAGSKVQHEQNDRGTQTLDTQDQADAKRDTGASSAIQPEHPHATNVKNMPTGGTLAEILAADILYAEDHSAFFVCLGIAPPYTHAHERFVAQVSDINRRLRSRDLNSLSGRDLNKDVPERKEQISTEPSVASEPSTIHSDFSTQDSGNDSDGGCINHHPDSSSTSIDINGGLCNRDLNKDVWGSEKQSLAEPSVSGAPSAIDNDQYSTQYLGNDFSPLDSNLPNLEQERKLSRSNWPELKRGVHRSKATPLTFEEKLHHRKSVRSYWQEYTRSRRRSIIASLRASNLEAFNQATAETKEPLEMNFRAPRRPRKMPRRFVPRSVYKTSRQYPKVVKLSRFWDIIQDHTYRPCQPLPEITLLDGTLLEDLLLQRTKLYKASKRAQGFFFPTTSDNITISGTRGAKKERLLPSRDSSRSSSAPRITLSDFSVVDSKDSNRRTDFSSLSSLMNLAEGEEISPEEAVEHLTNLINSALKVRTEILEHAGVIIEPHPGSPELGPNDEHVSMPDGIEIRPKSPELNDRMLDDIDIACERVLLDLSREDAHIYLKAGKTPSKTQEEHQHKACNLVEDARICGNLARQDEETSAQYDLQGEMELITKEWIQLLMEAFGREDDYY